MSRAVDRRSSDGGGPFHATRGRECQVQFDPESAVLVLLRGAKSILAIREPAFSEN